MLLPALNKAREKARAIKCVSNLKQIGLAEALYQHAYNDYLAPSLIPNHWWMWLLGEQMKGNGKIFTCPANTEGTLGLGTNPPDGDCPFTTAEVLGYTQNLMAGRYEGVYPSLKDTKSNHWKYPSLSILIMDNADNSSYIKCSRSVGIFDLRHNKRMNVLFVDGHVQPISYYEACLDAYNEVAKYHWSNEINKESGLIRP